MKGIRILDLTRVLAGPWATQQLADQGAEVIKVEPPGGDDTRGFGAIVEGESTYYVSANRNKRSIVLDLRTSAGRGVADRLVAGCDVVIENFRPGVAERLGLGWETLHPRFPGLVYVGIHAFGADGDFARRPGYDLVVQAMSGAASVTGVPGGAPLKHGTSIADLTAGMLAVQAVLFGLLHRERTGEGQKIVVNMLQAAVGCLTYHAGRHAVTGEVPGRRGSAHPGLVPYNLFECEDGWLAVAVGNDAIWQRLRTELDIPDALEWRTNVGRIQHREAVDAAVGAGLRALRVAEADARLTASGVPAGPVLDVQQALDHPAVTAATVQHPRLGSLALPGPLFTTATTRESHQCPPSMGGDREEILTELGYTLADQGELLAAGAFGAAPSS